MSARLILTKLVMNAKVRKKLFVLFNSALKSFNLLLPASTKILITSGYGNPVQELKYNYENWKRNGPGQMTEIVDLEDPSFSCTNAKDFPNPRAGSISGIIGNELMICGGVPVCCDDYYAQQQDCYKMQYTDDPKWTNDKSVVLNAGRYWSAKGSVIFDNQLVVVGGYDEREGELSTIELVSPRTGSRTLKTKLPWGLQGSCIVPWDESTVMVIGGGGSAPDGKWGRKETYFIDIAKDELKVGPSLLMDRFGHACHEIVVKGESYIMAVGGYGGEGDAALTTTEVLSKSNFKNGWEEGAKIPKDFHGFSNHQIVSSPDKEALYIIGNREISSPDIIKIYCSDNVYNCKFTRIDTKLKIGHWGHVVIPITSAWANKICN